jgi:hypothetical protein
MMDDQSWRNRVDKKLDEINQAIVTLARIDERIVTLFKRVERYENTQEEHTDKIADLEKSSESQIAVFSRAERFLWIIITVTVGSIGFWGK